MSISFMVISTLPTLWTLSLTSTCMILAFLLICKSPLPPNSTQGRHILRHCSWILPFYKLYFGSYHAQYLVSYRPPRRVIREYGYHVEYLLKTNTSMHGTSHHAHITVWGCFLSMLFIIFVCQDLERVIQPTSIGKCLHRRCEKMPKRPRFQCLQQPVPLLLQKHLTHLNLPFPSPP